MTSYIPFWSNDPTVLFNKKHILELFPQQGMTFDEKLNAITRLIILLCILGFMITRSYRFILNGSIALLIIYIMYNIILHLLLHKLHVKFASMFSDLCFFVVICLFQFEVLLQL